MLTLTAICSGVTSQTGVHISKNGQCIATGTCFILMEKCLLQKCKAGHKLPLNISGDKLAGVITKADGSNNKVDMFAVMADFVTALETNNTTNIQRAGTELDAVAKNLAKNITDNGLRQRIVEERQVIAEDKKLVYEGLLSGARDVDYATAITELSSHMLGLEAAQSTFAKVSQLTLFNFLR